MHLRGNDADSSDSAAMEGMLLVGTNVWRIYATLVAVRCGQASKVSGATHHVISTITFDLGLVNNRVVARSGVLAARNC